MMPLPWVSAEPLSQTEEIQLPVLKMVVMTRIRLSEPSSLDRQR